MTERSIRPHKNIHNRMVVDIFAGKWSLWSRGIVKRRLQGT